MQVLKAQAGACGEDGGGARRSDCGRWALVVWAADSDGSNAQDGRETRTRSEPLAGRCGEVLGTDSQLGFSFDPFDSHGV